MEEDIHGNNILKEYMSIVSRRKSLVNGYMISIQLSPIVDYVYKMYHVLNRRQKYIFHSAIENITKRKSWWRNAFMCMKDYGAKKGIGKIRIIHLIGQKVSFARRSICLCMRILIWKKLEFYWRRCLINVVIQSKIFRKYCIYHAHSLYIDGLRAAFYHQ